MEQQLTRTGDRSLQHHFWSTGSDPSYRPGVRYDCAGLSAYHVTFCGGCDLFGDRCRPESEPSTPLGMAKYYHSASGGGKETAEFWTRLQHSGTLLSWQIEIGGPGLSHCGRSCAASSFSWLRYCTPGRRLGLAINKTDVAPGQDLDLRCGGASARPG